MLKAEFLRRFVRSSWKNYARWRKGPYFVERRMGAFWLLDQYNIIDRRMFSDGSWEQAQVDRLGAYSRRMCSGGSRPHFLDIGSHAGLYAVLMRLSATFDRVVAIEPLPAHLDQLRANLLLNGLSTEVEVLECAASDAAGVLHFAPGPKSNRGMAHAIDGVSTGLLQKTPLKDLIEVKRCRLDDLLAISRSCLVIKMDVEGHEPAVIAGMTKLLTENRCVMQVEIVADAIKTTPVVLQKLGYQSLGSIALDHYYTNDPALSEERA